MYAIPFAYGRSFSYRLVISQKVTASGSVHSSSPGSESMDSDSDGWDDDDMKNGSGSDSSSNS